jgi:hypothetical protein
VKNSSAACNARTAIGRPASRQTLHPGCFTKLPELLRSQEILVNDSDCLLPIQYAVAHIQEMKMPATNLNVCIVSNLQLIEIACEFQTADPKSRIFDGLPDLINIHVSIFFENDLER